MGVPEVEGASPEAEVSFPDTGQGDRTLVTTVPHHRPAVPPSGRPQNVRAEGQNVRFGMSSIDLTASPPPRRLAIRNTPTAATATTDPAAGGPHARPRIDSARPHHPHTVRRALPRHLPD